MMHRAMSLAALLFNAHRTPPRVAETFHITTAQFRRMVVERKVRFE